MKNSITYAYLVHNEHTQLKKSIELVTRFMEDEDWVVILCDNPTNDVLLVIDELSKYILNLKAESRPLNKDFAAQKNYLNSLCTTDYIFNIDADEYPSEFLLTNIKTLLESNKQIDLFLLPRLNFVDGITQKDLDDWGWTLNKDLKILTSWKWSISSGNIWPVFDLLKKNNLIIDERDYYIPVIQYPDYQARLYKNDVNIKWHGKVHEHIIGYKSTTQLPAGINMDFNLYHVKDIARQRQQNEFYNTI